MTSTYSWFFVIAIWWHHYNAAMVMAALSFKSDVLQTRHCHRYVV